MPFGRYRGVEVADLSDGYLSWLHGLDDLDELLCSAVEREWDARFRPALEASALDPNVRTMAEELVAAGYRQLAKLHHPDRGGDTRAMQLRNDAATWLRRRVRSA
jgi:hypothetical protein